MKLATFIWLSAALLIGCVGAESGDSNAAKDVEQAFNDAAIYPEDVIPSPPKGKVEVEYEGGKEVDFDKISAFTPSDAAKPPARVDWKSAADANGGTNPSALYTLMMIDPDAPSKSRPNARNWLHWLVVNIPGTSVADGGDVCAEYNGPAPPPGSGPHRYIFLVYNQTQGQQVDAAACKQKEKKRDGFKVEQFLVDNEFGDQTPLAGNFFRTQRAAKGQSNRSAGLK